MANKKVILYEDNAGGIYIGVEDRSSAFELDGGSNFLDDATALHEDNIAVWSGQYWPIDEDWKEVANFDGKAVKVVGNPGHFAKQYLGI